MRKFSLRDKHLLALMLLICIGLMVLTFAIRAASGAASGVAYTVLHPMQEGVNRIGSYLTEFLDGTRSAKTLAAENRELREEIAALKDENAIYAQQLSELARLESLLALSEEYPEYEKIGAQVIAKDPGNWYNYLIVDRGSKDGVEVDMNVLANGGLFGIVTETGENWARIRAIIDDESNISAMVAETSDLCTVTGSLLDYNTGAIRFYGLRDINDLAREGDRIVTSHISGKYLPGFTIGYIDTLSRDSNNLTKSGRIIPSASFANVREVMIVLTTKQETEASE